jgi:hypothetical protein
MDRTIDEKIADIQKYLDEENKRIKEEELKKISYIG